MKIRILIFTLLCYYLNFGQSLNKEITDQGTPFLLGKINKEGLTSDNYKTWFSKEYDNYQPNQETINKISNILNDYTITMFLGTWCGDSKREVPRFYKVLEASNYPMEQLTVVALSGKSNMYKQSPNHEEKGLNIHRVPTFIFYKNGVEVNRIVESPVVSLEEDIQSILENNYEPNYKVVTKVNKMLQEFGTKKFNRKIKNQISVLKKNVKSMYELNTYARILKSTNRTKEAIEVLKLNTKLFPEKPGVFVSLANAFYSSDNKEEALVNYKKGLKLNPDNEKLKTTILRLKNNN
ncbi:MAG: thioredoxin family protein [Flavobacteriaceae bacterium]|nr:thioredoxin family protein [Flavobacteriaceae bacterium]